MNDNNPWDARFGIPMTVFTKSRDLDDVLKMYMTIWSKIKEITSEWAKYSRDFIPGDSSKAPAYHIYLIELEDGMKTDKNQPSYLLPTKKRKPLHKHDTNAVMAVIKKGRGFDEVMDQFTAIYDRAERVAATPGKSEAEVFADTMMCAVYRIYLLGVEDGMRKLKEDEK